MSNFSSINPALGSSAARLQVIMTLFGSGLRRFISAFVYDDYYGGIFDDYRGYNYGSVRCVSVR